MKKRILPALLALCMVMSLLPVSVFATTEKPAGCMEGCIVAEGDTAATHVDGCSTKCTPGADTCPNLSVSGGKHQDNCKAKAAADATCSCGCKYETCSACSKTGDTGTCGCGTNPCGEAACTKTRCTNEQCQDYNSVVDKPHTHTVPAACASGKNNSGLKSCTGSSHQADCPFVCPVSGCDLTADHPAAHKSGSVCSGDAWCSVATEEAQIDSHMTTCPKYATITAALTGGKKVGTYEGTKEVTFECKCNSFPHEDGTHKHLSTGTAAACGASKVFEAPVVFNFVYTYNADSNKTAAENEAAEKSAMESVISSTKESKETAAVNAYKTANNFSSWICPDCQAQLDGDDLAECTMGADCVTTNGEHLPNCLSRCTMRSTCTNAAHRVQYVVKQNGAVKGTYNVRADAVAQYEQLYNNAKSTYATAKSAYDSAVTTWNSSSKDDTAKATYDAAVTTWNAAVTAWNNNSKLSVGAVHCPQAQVPDGVVVAVNEDDAVTETPEPAAETRAPEKAEDLADVDGTEWFAEELTALIEKGIFTGSLDNGKYSFNAKDEMNTDMLVVLVSRVLGKDLNTTGANWADEATAWAAEEGLTEGVEAGKVTRADVVLVLWRAAGSPASEQSLEKFVDAEGLEGDQLTAMKWAVEVGIVKGSDKSELKADSVIIRSEMVAVIARFDGVANAD